MLPWQTALATSLPTAGASDSALRLLSGKLGAQETAEGLPWLLSTQGAPTSLCLPPQASAALPHSSAPAFPTTATAEQSPGHDSWVHVHPMTQATRCDCSNARSAAVAAECDAFDTDPGVPSSQTGLPSTLAMKAVDNCSLPPPLPCCLPPFFLFYYLQGLTALQHQSFPHCEAGSHGKRNRNTAG